MILTMVSVRKPSCTTYRELTEYGNAFNCLICIEAPSNPRELPCDHVFCEACLESYTRLFGSAEYVEGGQMPCPVCRKMTLAIENTEGGDMSSTDMTPTPESHLASRKISLVNETSQRCEACVYRLRVEEAEFYCSKCAMNYCSACKLAHDQIQVFKGHTVIHVRNKDTFNLYCDTHPKIVCMYFCHDCDRPVCTVCVLQGHRQHRTAKLRDALAGRRDLLKTLLNDFGPKLERLEMKVRKIQLTGNGNGHPVNGTSANGGIGCHPKGSPRSATPRSVHGSTRSVETCGSQDRTRKNGILTDYHLSADSILKSSSSFSNGDSEQMIAVDISGEVGFKEELLEDLASHVSRNRKLYDLSTKLIELSQSKKLLAVFQDVASRLRTVLELEFQRMHDDLEGQLTRAIEHCVKIAEPHGSDLESGSSTASSIRARHSSGVSSASGAEADGDGGSQSMLIRPKLVWKLEKQRSDVGEMWNPCGAAFIREDSLIVAEYDMLNDRNNKLRIFDREGRSHAVLAQGQIQPLGVAITREGHIAVTDCKGKRVKVLTLNGQTIIDIGKGQFGWPYGIAANSRGQLVITDAFNDSISIYHVDGKRIRTFGSSGSQNAQFRNPYHVTVDASDNIIVSDSGNNCVKAFDPSGRFLFSASETGVRRASLDLAFDGQPDRKTKRRRLKGPRGLSVDLKGNILVADDCSRVCMFDGAGKYVRNLLTEEDSVKYPEVVHCSSKGLLAVTEWNPANMYAVKVFKLYE